MTPRRWSGTLAIERRPPSSLRSHNPAPSGWPNRHPCPREPAGSQHGTLAATAEERQMIDNTTPAPVLPGDFAAGERTDLPTPEEAREEAHQGDFAAGSGPTPRHRKRCWRRASTATSPPANGGSPSRRRTTSREPSPTAPTAAAKAQASPSPGAPIARRPPRRESRDAGRFRVRCRPCGADESGHTVSVEDGDVVSRRSSGSCPAGGPREAREPAAGAGRPSG